MGCPCPGGTPARNRTFTPKKEKPPFRKDISEVVEYGGELPYEYRGEITGTLYVWNSRKPLSVRVDRRDLPGLMSDTGIDSLDGAWIAEFKKHKAAREKAARKKEELEEKSTEKPERESDEGVDNAV
jgi:hypothetical protein